MPRKDKDPKLVTPLGRSITKEQSGKLVLKPSVRLEIEDPAPHLACAWEDKLEQLIALTGEDKDGPAITEAILSVLATKPSFGPDLGFVGTVQLPGDDERFEKLIMASPTLVALGTYFDWVPTKERTFELFLKHAAASQRTVILTPDAETYPHQSKEDREAFLEELVSLVPSPRPKSFIMRAVPSNPYYSAVITDRHLWIKHPFTSKRMHTTFWVYARTDSKSDHYLAIKDELSNLEKTGRNMLRGNVVARSVAPSQQAVRVAPKRKKPR